MKMKICNDISHSYLACNTFGWDYYNYIKKLLPHTAHYHISDGSDHSGEGLQIGKGTIDFNKVCKIIKSHNKQVTFIPEIWQGHTNNGAGFLAKSKNIGWKNLMNIVAIIPARGNSKGIEEKNIINFCDKPLIYWTIKQALNSKYIKSNVFVSSDNKKILDISKNYGAIPILRPCNLATDKSSSEEALLHAINEIEKNDIDLVIFTMHISFKRIR